MRRIKGTRLLTLGVLPEYQRQGLDALLLHELYGATLRRGYAWCEVGWILETNQVLNNAIRPWGFRPSTRYRLYERALAPGPLETRRSTPGQADTPSSRHYSDVPARHARRAT